jgi:hypothetical protein
MVGRRCGQPPCLILALFCAGSPAAYASGLISEDLRIPMAEAGPRGLEAFLMRPADPGKYPLALISHGSPRKSDDRPDMTARKYEPIAAEFARRGFAALVVLRRGYGTSPGGLVDSYGSCSRPNYSRALAAGCGVAGLLLLAGVVAWIAISREANAADVQAAPWIGLAFAVSALLTWLIGRAARYVLAGT